MSDSRDDLAAALQADALAGAEQPLASAASPQPALTPASAIAGRATRGVVIYVLRLGATQVLQVASSLLLARAVQPGSYGTFALALTLVGTARYLGDLGVAFYLIVKRDVSEAEFQAQAFVSLAVATLSGVAIAAVGALGLVAASDVPGGRLIAGVLGVTLVLNSLRSAPAVRLERELAFERLGTIGIVETAVLYVVQTALLLSGAGIWALAVAHLAGAVVGTAVTFKLGHGVVWPAPRGLARSLVRRGLPFQSSLILVAGLGLLSPVLITAQLGGRGFGFWAWSTVVATPFLAVLALVQNVATSSLARLRESAESRHTEATDLILRLMLLVAGISAGALIGLAHGLIVVVFDSRWLPAEGAMQVGLAGLMFSAAQQALSAHIDSQGLARKRLIATAVAAVCAIAALVPLTALLGVTGAAIATAIVLPAVDSVVMARQTRLRVVRALVQSALVLGVAAAVSLTLGPQAHDLGKLVAVGVAAAAAGAAVACLVDRHVVRFVIRYAR